MSIVVAYGFGLISHRDRTASPDHDTVINGQREDSLGSLADGILITELDPTLAYLMQRCPSFAQVPNGFAGGPGGPSEASNRAGGYHGKESA